MEVEAKDQKALKKPLMGSKSFSVLEAVDKAAEKTSVRGWI